MPLFGSSSGLLGKKQLPKSRTAFLHKLPEWVHRHEHNRSTNSLLDLINFSDFSLPQQP